MKTPHRRFLLALIAPLLAAWLFLGLYQDREFFTVYLFLKHRPSLKLHFFTPIGESDKDIKDLPPRFQREEEAFNEFVEEGGGYNRAVPLWK